MAPTIEIYDERELCSNTLTVETDDEALALINELGLHRQVSDSGSRMAYPQPTADQGFAMAVCFPQSTKLEDYDAGCIPLRVLKEIRSYRSEHPDHILLVRHSAPAQVMDPVLLAFTETQHTWMWDRSDSWRNFRLIARWGDALEPWEILVEKARAMMAVSAAEAIDRIIRRATALRESIKSSGSYPSQTLPEIANLPQGW